MSSGLFERKHEDCETRTTQLMGAWLEKLTDRMVTHIKAAMETRRHPNGYDEPDYERILREREGGININGYNERGYKEPSWRDWMMNILGGLIVIGIGAVIYQLEDLKSSMAASLARQEMDERRIDRIEQHLYRGNP